MAVMISFSYPSLNVLYLLTRLLEQGDERTDCVGYHGDVRLPRGGVRAPEVASSAPLDVSAAVGSGRLTGRVNVIAVTSQRDVGSEQAPRTGDGGEMPGARLRNKP